MNLLAKTQRFLSPQARELQKEVDQLPWFHQIDFGGGVVTKGRSKIGHLNARADVFFANSIVKNRTFLDVGCWDGYNSLLALRKGASRVLATDHFAWSEHCWGDRRAFELVRKHLAPQIEVAELELSEVKVDRIGSFEVVLFAGVFYHLRNPFCVLQQLAELTSECLIIETHIDAMDISRPAMIFYPGDTLHGDCTNWWGPNPSCIEAMLREVGFARIETSIGIVHEERAIFRAFR
ncbi:MAG: class I SAM-dependent methyltransferase [Rhodomicrobiaceae bacterium]